MCKTYRFRHKDFTKDNSRLPARQQNINDSKILNFYHPIIINNIINIRVQYEDIIQQRNLLSNPLLHELKL